MKILYHIWYNKACMCGIFAYSGKKNNAGEIILEGLKSLEYRGYDSWGIALQKEDHALFIEKHIGKIGDAKLPHLNSSVGIGHTRWATHGGVTQENAHPHTDCKKEVVVVHNGIVENFELFKTELLNKGHRFRSDTDTEVIAHLVEEGLKEEKNLQKVVLSVFNKLAGLNAIIIFYPLTNQFAAIKSGSPLVFGYNKKLQESFLASDSFSILPHTQDLYFLEDNELLMIDHEGFTLSSLQGKAKTLAFSKIPYTKDELVLGAFKDYMSKEIFEQPKVLLELIKHEEKNIQTFAKHIEKAYGTYFIGCGTASYATLAGTYLFSKIAHRHVNVAVGSEFSWLVDFLKKKSLVVAFSQSGETVDIISSVAAAREKGANIAAVTNVLGSTLYRSADYKILLGAGPEKAVCATKSFTAKIAMLILLAHCLDGGYSLGKKKVELAIEEVKKILKNAEQIHKLALKLKNSKHIYILGRGLSYPAALESTLKIKEVSYIHAEGFAGGELKHGVIALIEKGTPVIVYNPEDETYQDTLSSAHEVKARGAYVIGISSKPNDVYDEFIQVNDCEEATIIPNVVIAQLLGYYLAKTKRLDPDKPRNLAKSVTVI